MQLILLTIVSVFFTILLSCKQNSSPFRDEHSLDTNTEDLTQSEMDIRQAYRCRQSGKVWDKENRKCITQQQFCVAKNDGSVWKEIGGKETCLTLREQCLLEKGAQWVDETCKSARQVCDSRNDGSQFVNGVCLTPKEVCDQEGYHYKWQESGSCDLKNFMDYCQDANPEPEPEKTVGELKRIAGAAEGLTGMASCTQAYKWLKAQTELRLLDTGDQLQLTDIYPLAEFTGLKKLELTNNRISDLLPVAKMVNLEFLDLQNNRNLKYLDHLAGLENLRYLFLGYNKIIDLKPLGGLKKLELLSLFDNTVSDLKPLEGLVTLKSLHLKSNPVRSLFDLRNLYELVDLNISLTPLERGDVSLSESNCPNEGKLAPAVKIFCTAARK